MQQRHSEHIEKLREANHGFAARFPGESGARQPVHVVYGGAHLFKAESAQKLGALALRSLAQFAPDAATFGRVFGVEGVYDRVVEKLKREPVEAYHIDFEDGYGQRSSAEEESHAVSAATEVAKGLLAGSLPPFLGIRIKSFTDERMERSFRTLRTFLHRLIDESEGRIPGNFVVTYPKAAMPQHLEVLAEFLTDIEAEFGIGSKAIGIELMIETPQSIAILRELADAAHDRCVAAHFGSFDYTAACGITAAYQTARHPACDFVRNMMQAAYAGTGIRLSDGITNVLPVGNDPEVIHRAWRLHYDNIRYSLECGFYQSWDLHPAQLVARYAAVYAFFREGLQAARDRLSNFRAAAEQATRVGDVFDDAASVRGLTNYFQRALNCGAIDPSEAL